ncbi:MAG: hypothetical protein ACK5EI_09335, partial [Bacteroidota bacterium]
KKDTIAVVAKKVAEVKKDTIAVVAKKVAELKKDTIAVVAKKVVEVKKDTIAVVAKKVAEVKKDTIAVVKTVDNKKVEKAKPTAVQSDTIAIAKVQPSTVNSQPSTVNRQPSTLQQDSFVVVKPQSKPAAVQPTTNNQQLTTDEEDRITREELLAALDSLAKLRREQERIVEYLTKRINKKPIEVFTYADSVTVEIFDSGIHDKDSVSVIYNRTLVVDKHELKVNKPIKFKVRVDKERRNNEMVIVAENLGTYPPNTAVMIITDKFGKHEEIMLSTDLTTNEVVIFIRIDKQADSNPTKNKP